MTALYAFDEVSYTAPPRNTDTEPTRILDGATFELARGTFAIIVGPSGSGKTTLLRLFNRLADPTSGTILFEGKDIREQPVLELRRRIGWVPQVPVRFPGTVDANLRLPFSLNRKAGFAAGEIDKSVDELKALELLPPELYRRDASDLSVGEAQRLNLLRALALRPEVLLLDEPTSALDPEMADALLGHILRIQREKNLTAIMVSHRPDEVRKLNGTVLSMRDGRVHVEEAEGDM
jgi:ABC-type proline/glycine betaine transport system ATPase subunit